MLIYVKGTKKSYLHLYQLSQGIGSSRSLMQSSSINPGQTVSFEVQTTHSYLIEVEHDDDRTDLAQGQQQAPEGNKAA